MSILYIGLLTTGCCLIAVVRHRCALIPRTLLLYLLHVTSSMSFCHRPTFSFSYSVSVVSASSSVPLHRRLPTVFFRLSPSSLFISSPCMFHPPCLISSSNRSLPSASLLHLPRSLDPLAFYYSPITSGTAPRLLALQRFPQAGWSCYTIFYCVFTAGHNYY